MGSLDKIYLIGMPGAGKTTLGKALANELSITFIDLDEKIEQAEQRSIKDIFELNGEEYFRSIENKLLKELSERECRFVMATGGGTPCFYEAIELMLKVGKVIFIDVDPEVLTARVLSQGDTRPKYNQLGDLKSQISGLLQKRQAIYECAHISIKKDDVSAEEILARLKE